MNHSIKTRVDLFSAFMLQAKLTNQLANTRFNPNLQVHFPEQDDR